jgi:hypothetical protein
MLFPSSGSKNKTNKKPEQKPVSSRIFFRAGFLLGFFYNPEDEGDIFLRNVG